MRQTTTAPAQGGPTELTKAELKLVAGGQAESSGASPPTGGTTIAVGAAASNTALVAQANVFRVRFG